MELLKDPKRMEAAKTFLMVPLWDDRPPESNSLKGKCENCGERVAWQAESAVLMAELKTHLLCPECAGHLVAIMARHGIENLGHLDNGVLRRKAS